MKGHTKESFAKLIDELGLSLAVLLAANELPDNFFEQLTIEQCFEIKPIGYKHNDFPERIKIHEAIMQRIISLVKNANTADIELVLKAYALSISENWPEHRELKSISEDKIQQLNFLETLNTFEACLKSHKMLTNSCYCCGAWWYILKKHPLIKKCEEKLVELAETFENWVEIYRLSIVYEPTKSCVFRKIEEQIENCMSIEKMRMLYEICKSEKDRGCEYQELYDKCINKLVRLLPAPTDTFQDCAWLYKQVYFRDCFDKQRKILLERLKKLYRESQNHN